MKTPIVKITTELSDLRQLSTTLWFSGCKLHCKGCQNSGLKEFKTKYSYEYVKTALTERRKLTDWLVFSGGNPIDHIDWVLQISKFAKELNYKQFLFSGYTHLEIEKILTFDQNKYLIENIDYIKAGGYDATKSKHKYNCSDYFFETLNQYVVKSNKETQKWNMYYYYVPGNSIPTWTL